MAQEQEKSDLINGESGKVPIITSFKPLLVLPSSKIDEAVCFYKAVFGAEELNRMNHPKRKADQDHPLLMCVELKIGATSFLICDQNDEIVASEGFGSGIVFRLETGDVAGVVAKAVEAGVVADGDIANVEGTCGGLLRKVKDPFGFVWVIVSSD